ncbi:MAG: ferredoxin, partial [Clostridiales bacterium]|nr:ferredoxin [Clostridiales bacterium]
MIYGSFETERNAALRVAELMIAAARTAPKACGIDNVESMILDGPEKDALTATMRLLSDENQESFYARDAICVDDCPCIVLIGVRVDPRGLDCALCGVK